jgi:predicted ATPase
VYSSFSIRNFRGLTDLSLPEFGRVNLISGPNDVGKTAVLEALFLHASGPLAAQLAIQVLRPARAQSALEFSASAESPWNGFFRQFDPTNVITLQGTNDGVNYRLSLSQPSTEQPFGIGKGESAQQVWSSQLQIEEQRDSRAPQTYTSTFTVQTGSLPGVSGQQAIVQSNIEPHASRPFVPARLLPTNRAFGTDLGAGYSTLRQRGRSGDLLNALQAVDPRIRSLELLLSDARPTLHAVLRDDTLIPFPLMGDGISSVAALVVGMIDVRGGLLIVDEFENGLHYSVLKDLWFQVFTVARRLEVQVFAATHSHECVVAAHEALSGQPRALQLLQLARNPDDPSSPLVAAYDTDALRAGIEMDASLR